MLKFLVDESIGFKVVEALQQDGHDVEAVVKVMSGSKNRKEIPGKFVVATEDKVRIRPPFP